MKRLRFFSITLLIILGCSSVQKTTRPPLTELMPPEVASWPINDQLIGDKDFLSIDLFLNRVAKENPTQSTIWWADYRRAQLWSKKDKNVACENYSRLANEQNFPIRRLAYMRAHKLCPKNNQILARLEAFDVNKFEPWLSSEAVDLAITKAKENNDKPALVELFLKKSKMNLRKEEKVAHADEALKYALQLQDKEKIRELQNRIYNLSPSRQPQPTPKDHLAMANDYRYLRQFDLALKYYDRVINSRTSPLNDKLQALRSIRTTYKIQQKTPESIAATERLAQFVERHYKKSKKTVADAKLYADAQLLLARTYWTDNQIKKTQKTLDQIEKTVGGKVSIAELYWMRGRIEEENQNFAESAKLFRKALDEKPENSAFADKITWYLSWNERKQKNYPEATRLLKELRDRSESNFEKSRYAFWLAKTYAEAGEPDDAKDEFKKLIKVDPLSFYGLLAFREINEPLPKNMVRAEDNETQKAQTNLPHELRSRIDENYLAWLIATKEDNVAKDYLDTVAAQIRKLYPNDIDIWTSLLHLYTKTQNYLALFSQINMLPTAMRRTILESNPKLIFPNPYFETVSKAASRFGISLEFIYSIMRQESSFNPQARSQMDAFGLMQLLPEVARRSASANAIDFTNTDDLYEPHINIPIGSAYLRELWDKYNGELVLAVASYNASEKAILSWLKTRFRGDSVEFIEDIPYDETRDYVKLVLRNLITYQIINSRDEQIAFPDWTLKISYQNTPEGARAD